MIVALYAICVGLFVWLIRATALAASIRNLFATLAGTARKLAEKGLSEAERERLARSKGIEALRLLATVLLKMAAVVAAATSPALILDAVGYLAAGDVLAFSLRPVVIVATCAFFVLVPLVSGRLQGSTPVAK